MNSWARHFTRRQLAESNGLKIGLHKYYEAALNGETPKGRMYVTVTCVENASRVDYVYEDMKEAIDDNVGRDSQGAHALLTR
jgi:hypothetical protein